MSLVKFNAQLQYESAESSHEVAFTTQPASDGNATLVRLIKHTAWMAGVGGNAEAAREAFETGMQEGLDRAAHLAQFKKTTTE